ncbi:MAG: DUF503 domain-containing protein [Anaerolineales bacterium]|nr:DUF503 domain-containing protein [Anaerolineales bacterium]
MSGDTVHIGLLTIQLYIPGCASLKHKRSVLKPLLAALHKNYNISAAEIGAHDYHQSAVLACGLVSNSQQHIQPILEKIPRWIEKTRPDVQIVDYEFSML